ncbi:MAG: hypothetical protein ACE147_20160 [Candidatus Methylomirabilales bacterium]
MDLTKLRSDIEAYAGALSREEYLTRAGLKDESRAAAIREAFPALASRALFEEARERADAEQDPEPKRGLRFAAEFLGTNVVEYAVRALSDRLLSLEATRTITADAEGIPLRSAEVRVKNEAERPRRAAIDAVRLRAVEELNGLRRDMLEASHAEVDRLGFPGYAAFCQTLSGIDLVALRDLVQPILARTADAYRDLLEWQLKRRLGVEPREARRHDLVRLLRAAELDPVFPPSAMREAAEAPLRRMGLDPGAGGRIRVDDEARPTKVPRAFVATLRIPQDVVLVVRPVGGLDDYFSYLHELGHALHFAHSDPGLPVEFRRLGDSSVSEAWAFLFDNLLRERLWLRRFLDLPQPGDALRFTAFLKLWYLRRYAAKLEYELFLHEGGPDARAADAYRELLSGATMVDWPREMYLADVDPFFYAARYLRAWVFEAQLKAQIREQFDEEWFRNDRTGPFLAQLWRQGQRHTLEELREQLGLGEPSVEPLLSQILADL